MKFFLAIATFICLASTVQATPWIAEARTDEYWLQRHALFKKTTYEKGNEIKAIFYGDSITEAWNTCAASGEEIWDEKYKPLGAVNYGIGADRTEHLLYRIDDGEVDGLYPKVVVLLIGTNNRNDSAADVAKGIIAVKDLLREKLPKAKILILGVLPRQDPETGTPEYWFSRVMDINIRTSKSEDKKYTFFLDMIHQFSTAWAQIDEVLYDPDQLHLLEPGYQKWADTMDHLFTELYYDTYDDECRKKYDY